MEVGIRPLFQRMDSSLGGGDGGELRRLKFCNGVVPKGLCCTWAERQQALVNSVLLSGLLGLSCKDIRRGVLALGLSL